MCQDRNAVPDENVSEVKSVIVTINSIKNQKSLRSTDAIGSGITFRHHLLWQGEELKMVNEDDREV